MLSFFKTLTMQKYIKPVTELSKDILQFCRDFFIPVIIILVVYFLGYAVFFTINENKKNKNELLAENKNLFLVFLMGLAKALFKFFANLPKILITTVALLGLNLILSITGEVNEFISNEKKINELSAVVKNLSRSDTIASFTVNEKRIFKNQKKELLVTFKILSPEGDVVSSQNLIINGEEIWVDFVNLNFEYSMIESGKTTNIAYPYRVYSENLASSDAIPLSCVFN